MAITLIKSPEFKVNVATIAPEALRAAPLSLTIRVSKITQNALKSFVQALYLTAKYSPSSFKIIVLGYYGSLAHPSFNLYTVAFKIVFWAASLFIGVSTTTIRLYSEKSRTHSLNPNDHPLNSFAGNDLNPLHIQTKDKSLNVSLVPSEVKVANLLTILNEINFTTPGNPGYMAPQSRQEGSTTYTQADLKAALTTFVRHVTNRTPFLGTPKATDMPRLLAFYQQIEDAVRLSIDKSNKQLTAFKAENGEDTSKYNGAVKTAYANLLEDRARIAIDLAIAGKHCGARYMGDSMTVYYSFYDQESSQGLSLKEQFMEILAHKRKQIAAGQIQRHLGNGTHAYSNYMGSIGKLLAVPGATNIIETLSNPLDESKYLELFFKEYNDVCVIETIQEAIKKKGDFRNLILDWIKDQCGNWNKEVYDAKASAVSTELQAIIASESAAADTTNPYSLLESLLKSLKDKKTDLPSLDEGWDNFIEELLALGEAREWRNETFKHLTSTQIRLAANKLKTDLGEAKISSSVAEDLAKSIQETGLINASTFSGAALPSTKLQKMQQCLAKAKIPPINEETLARVLAGTTNLSQVMNDHFNAIRHGDFLDSLQLGKIGEDNLRGEIMEWLLVSFEIFRPQQTTIGA